MRAWSAILVVLFALFVANPAFAQESQKPTQAANGPYVVQYQILTFPLHIVGLAVGVGAGAILSRGGNAGYVFPGILVATPLIGGFSTWGVGELSGGDGRFWATAVGSLVGTGLGIGIVVGVDELAGVDFSPIAGAVVTSVLVGMLSTGGAIMGYGLTRDAEGERKKAIQDLQAFTVPNNGGLTIGLSGSF